MGRCLLADCLDFELSEGLLAPLPWNANRPVSEANDWDFSFANQLVHHTDRWKS
jgi:hypothetical protein